MSLNPVPLNITPIIDPRINVNNERTFTVLKGGSQITYKPIISTSYSQSSATFSATPPNNKSLVCSNIYIDQNYLFTFTGTSTSGNLLKIGTYDAPASFLTCKATQTLQMQLNNTAITLNYSDFFPYLFRYEQALELGRYDLSSTTDMLDEHNDLNAWVTLGSARNPLALYMENSARGTRGGFAGIEIISNTPTSAQVRVNVIEPLFIPGVLNWNDEKLKSALTNLQTHDITFTYNNNLAHLWSHSTASPNTITTIDVTINDNRAPILLFNYISSDYLQIIPPTITYDYADLQRYPTNIGTITAGSTFNVSSNNIQLRAVPRCMYIFARESNSSLSEISTDCFASLVSLNIDWNNRNGLLGSATPNDLYRISRKNGCNLSYSQWTNYVGSPMCVMFDEDIGTGSDPLEVSSVSGNFQLQINATFKNIFSRSVNFTFYVVVVNDGTLTITNNTSILSTSVLSKEDVYKANQESAYQDYAYYRQMTGRGFLQNMGEAIRKTNRFINKKAIPAMQGVANTITRGREGLETIQRAIGQGEGGARLTRDMLRENIRKLN